MKRFTLYLFTAMLAGASLLSCVRDEEDLFDQASSARMAATLEAAQTVLTGASNGWIMYYYPNGAGQSSGTQAIGGYTYTMVFTEDGEVTVWSELTDEPSTSLYNLCADDGPVLTFDTFNYNLHYFATPAGSNKNIYGVAGSTYYQAFKGDFNFKIMSATSDEIILLGKRSRNYYKMYPLPSEYTPAEYVRDAASVPESIYQTSYSDGSVNMVLNPSTRQLTFTPEGSEESVTSAFAFIPGGMKLYKAVTVGGVKFDEMSIAWDGDNNTITANGVSYGGSYPYGWLDYYSFPGEYTLYYCTSASNYNKGVFVTLDITISEKEAKKTFTISGIGKTYDIEAGYDIASGTISICAQVVGQESGYYYQLAAYAAAQGYVKYTSDVGMTGTWDPDVTEAQTIFFKDNGAWKTYQVSSFIIYKFTNAGSRVGGVSSGDWSLNTGNQYLRYVSQMVKK